MANCGKEKRGMVSSVTILKDLSLISKNSLMKSGNSKDFISMYLLEHEAIGVYNILLPK
jgi:hypothetical protein